MLKLGVAFWRFDADVRLHRDLGPAAIRSVVIDLRLVARRSFQAGGQRGSLYLIAVSIKSLTDLFKNIFPEVAPSPPCWIVVEGSKL